MAPTIDIMDVTGGENSVMVTVRVFETGFGSTDFSGQVTVATDIGGERSSTDIRGTAGAGTDAYETQVALINEAFRGEDEVYVAAVLDNGEQEQGFFDISAGGGGGAGGGSYTVTNCSTDRTPGGRLSIPFTVDGPGSGSFTATVYVDGQAVESREWQILSPPTSYEEVVDPDDLPIGQDMPVEIEVDGETFRCGSVDVASDTGPGTPPGEEPPVDQPAITPDDLSISCLGSTLDDSVRVGFSTNPLYNVTNFANADVRATIGVIVNGQQIDSDQVDIPQGQTASGRVPIRFDEPGTYDVGYEVVDVQVI
jgi:hypothetical protein